LGCHTGVDQPPVMLEAAATLANERKIQQSTVATNKRRHAGLLTVRGCCPSPPSEDVLTLSAFSCIHPDNIASPVPAPVDGVVTIDVSDLERLSHEQERGQTDTG